MLCLSRLPLPAAVAAPSAERRSLAVASVAVLSGREATSRRPTGLQALANGFKTTVAGETGVELVGGAAGKLVGTFK